MPISAAASSAGERVAITLASTQGEPKWAIAEGAEGAAEDVAAQGDAVAFAEPGGDRGGDRPR